MNDRDNWVAVDMTFPVAYEDFGTWPESIEVDMIERNGRGERRIRETRTYRLAPLDNGTE